MPIKYKYALFDWDGCLSNTLENAKSIIMTLAKEKGVEFSDTQAIAVFGDWEKAAKALGYNQVDQLKEDYSQMVFDSILDVELNEGARQILQNLNDKNIPVGIVTTSSKEYVIKQAEKDNIIDLYDYLIGFEHVVRTKPHPEPIAKMLNLMKADKGDSVMIGDTDKDIIAANRAGIDSILYRSDYNKKFYGEYEPAKQEEIPKYKITKLSELESYF
jgi:HAD superfamily hydrolase (TIGR01509 family)